MKTQPFAFALGASLLLAALCGGCAASAGSESSFDSPSGGSQRGVGKADSTETGTQLGELDVDPSLVVAVAVHEAGQTPSLMVIRQIPRNQKCWAEQGQNPTAVDPLLLGFDFAEQCVLATDDKGYGVRMGGVDQSASYRLVVQEKDDDLVLVAQSADETVTIGRTHGVSAGSHTKLSLEPDWRITLQSFGRKPTGLMYFSRVSGTTGSRGSGDRGTGGAGGAGGAGGTAGTGGSAGESQAGGSAGAGGMGGAAPGDCGTLTVEGQCDGDTLTWCESGAKKTLVCSQGTTCGWNADKNYYDCMASAATGCGAVTAEGDCEGAVLSWCDAGQIKTFDCASLNQTCGWSTVNNYNDCVPPPQTGCGEVTKTGACNGDVVIWCESGELKSVDCAALGSTCGWSDTANFYDCT